MAGMLFEEEAWMYVNLSFILRPKLSFPRLAELVVKFILRLCKIEEL